MESKKAQLQALIEGILFKLSPITNVYNVFVDDTTTLASKLSEVITSLNAKAKTEDVGDISKLYTEKKDNLVNAINEIFESLGDPISKEEIEQVISDYFVNNPYPVSSVNGKKGVVELTAEDVGALPENTKIPSKTSDITNDSGFINNAVSDLINYYTKTQSYTKEEINNLVSIIPKFAISVVSELPVSNISETTIYLVSGGSGEDLYTEYLRVNGNWEVLGSQKVDFTGYATENWVNIKLYDYLKSSELESAINTALEQAKSSGEFDGKDGQDGQDGMNGKDGVSPTVSVANITGGHRITITDANGTKTVDVMDGSDGQDGSPGANGKDGEDGNGIKSAVLNTDYTLTLTFDDGTSYTTPSIRGATGGKGDKGSDGFSPSVQIEQITDGAVVSIRDFNGVTSATITNGKDGATGATGQRGTGLLPVTTAPSSYTTAVGGITPKYRMALSTIKTQAGVTEVLLGDTVRYSYYHYPIAYLDASYAYMTTRVSIRGATGADGAAGASVTVSSVTESTEDGGENVVAFSDGNTLTVKNGSKGSAGNIDYDKMVKTIAHRGYSIGAPENTIPAYIAAKQQGYGYVECDVSWTSDGVAVLLHDDTIDRTSNGTGNIDSMTYEQVFGYDFGSWFSETFAGTKIATFEEFMKFCRAVGLYAYIDLKTTGLTQERVTALVNTVKATGMSGKVSYISFYSSTALTYVKNTDPTARLGYLADATSENLTKLQGLKTATNEVFFDSEYGSVSDTTVSLAMENGIPMEVYTVDSSAVIEDLHPYITGVTSNFLIAGKVLYEKYMGYILPDAPEPAYTNLVPTSIDTDGSVFNGVGYMNGYRLSSSGSTKAESGKTVTGFIPCPSEGVVRVAGLDWTTGGYINYYDSNFGFLGAFAYNARYEFCLGDAWTWEKTPELTTVYTIADTRIAYIRVSLIGTGDQLIVTVNQEITA